MALGAIALEIAHLIFGQTLHLGAIQVSYFDQIIPLGFNHRGGVVLTPAQQHSWPRFYLAGSRRR